MSTFAFNYMTHYPLLKICHVLLSLFRSKCIVSDWRSSKNIDHRIASCALVQPLECVCAGVRARECFKCPLPVLLSQIHAKRTNNICSKCWQALSLFTVYTQRIQMSLCFVAKQSPNQSHRIVAVTNLINFLCSLWVTPFLSSPPASYRQIIPPPNVLIHISAHTTATLSLISLLLFTGGLVVYFGF